MHVAARRGENEVAARPVWRPEAASGFKVREAVP